MRNKVLTAIAVILLLAVSCSKSAEGNKSVISPVTEYSADLPKDSGTVPPSVETGEEYTERYVGDDKTSALVTFKNKEKDKSISVRSNNKTISAPQKEAWPGGGIYENFDYRITVKNDSVVITQGDNVINLVKARGN